MTGVVEMADQGQGNRQEVEERQEPQVENGKQENATVEKGNTQNDSPAKFMKNFGLIGSIKKKINELGSMIPHPSGTEEDKQKAEDDPETQTWQPIFSGNTAQTLELNESSETDSSSTQPNDQVKTEKPEINSCLSEGREGINVSKSNDTHQIETEAKEQKNEEKNKTPTPASDSQSKAAGQVKPSGKNAMFSSFRTKKFSKSQKTKQVSHSLETVEGEDDPQREPLSPKSSEQEDVKNETPNPQTLSEDYELQEIPVIPLSVMQINSHIEMEHLEEAHVNLLSMRQELKKELQENGREDTPIEMAKKEKDLNLLYRALQDKIKNIIRDSSSEQSCNTELLVSVVRIIQEEGKREKDPGSGEWSWRDTWKEAVLEGVKAKIKSVHLDSKEQNKSWLAVHLGQLGRVVVEDLENVKNRLTGCYPPSFNVFNTYVGSYHQAIAQHIRDISQKELETKDSYALLKWILNDYKSENIMGSPTLQPDMGNYNVTLPLEDTFLNEIKEKHCNQIKENLKINLENIIKLQEESWTGNKEPDLEDGFYHSEIHIDVWTVVKGYITHSGNIDVDLQKKVVCACMVELMHFPQNFETQFNGWSESQTAPSLGVRYTVAYINSFTALKGHLEEFREIKPKQVVGLEKKMEAVVQSLGQTLMDKFKADIERYLRRMMTKKWLSTDTDFQEILKKTKELSEHCKAMKPPYVQTFVAKVHYHVVKEYISRLMQSNYSCKNVNHVVAAKKMGKEWEDLQEVFVDLKSDAAWVYPVGKYLSEIVGQRNEKNIKNNLEPLVRDYPDISHQHLLAVLNFRGGVQSQERMLIRQRLEDLRKTAGATGVRDQALFGDIQAAANMGCQAIFPCVCVPLSLHDR